MPNVGTSPSGYPHMRDHAAFTSTNCASREITMPSFDAIASRRNRSSLAFSASSACFRRTSAPSCPAMNVTRSRFGPELQRPPGRVPDAVERHRVRGIEILGVAHAIGNGLEQLLRGDIAHDRREIPPTTRRLVRDDDL